MVIESDPRGVDPNRLLRKHLAAITARRPDIRHVAPDPSRPLSLPPWKEENKFLATNYYTRLTQATELNLANEQLFQRIAETKSVVKSTRAKEELEARHVLMCRIAKVPAPPETARVTKKERQRLEDRWHSRPLLAKETPLGSDSFAIEQARRAVEKAEVKAENTRVRRRRRRFIAEVKETSMIASECVRSRPGYGPIPHLREVAPRPMPRVGQAHAPLRQLISQSSLPQLSLLEREVPPLRLEVVSPKKKYATGKAVRPEPDPEYPATVSTEQLLQEKIDVTNL